MTRNISYKFYTKLYKI